MKFSVDRQEFQRAINIVEGIIPAREIRSVISNILVEAEGERITLTTTDLEIAIKTSLAGEVHAAGRITLPAKKLSQSIREFRSSRVMLEIDRENRLTLHDASSVSRARLTLMGAPAEEYPVIPTLAAKNFSPFPTETAMEMIRKTSYAIAEEDARYVFNGLFMVPAGKKVAFVGTDGRRLAKIERAIPAELPFQEGVIIPNKAVRELNKLLDAGTESQIAFEHKDRRIHFRLGEVVLVSKLIEGQFPDYEQVIPKKLSFSVILDRMAFENSLRQVSVMAAEPSRQVHLKFAAGAISINASTPDLGEAQDSLEADYAGEEMTIAFNSNYIMDILKVLPVEKISIGFSSPSAPAVIRDPADPDFITVIMPMKI